MVKNQLSFKTGLVNPAEWAAFAENSPLPLQQHPTYGRALEMFGATAQQVTISDGDTIIARALLIQRKFFGLINFTTLFRGPVWNTPDLDDTLKEQAFQGLREHYSPWRWNFLCVMPELKNADNNTALLKQAGLRRVMTGFSTAWMDLRPETDELRASLKGKWRNQLVRAEKENLEISVGGRKPHQYSWLLNKETEQRSNRRYQATPIDLVPAFVKASTPKSNSEVLSVAALSNKRKIAGALFLLHGNSATYHIGWAGDDARKINAQNQVLWAGMLALKERGIKFLDLGGLNTADLGGIARFKLGTGAQPVTLTGAYL